MYVDHDLNKAIDFLKVIILKTFPSMHDAVEIHEELLEEFFTHAPSLAILGLPDNIRIIGLLPDELVRNPVATRRFI